MSRDVELAINISTDARRAGADLEALGRSARDMGGDLDRAGRDLDSLAESADGVASRSSQVAGGLGDLGGALAQLPGPLGQVGTGMEMLGPSIMGVTGAADLMNAAMDSTVIRNARARASTIAHTVAEKARTVATKAAAVAQRALNLVMRMNPIGLVVTAIAALVAGFILAYKRSDSFRRIVDRVWAAIKTAGRWIFDTGKKVAAFALKWSPLGIAVRLVRDNFGQVVGKLRDVHTWMVNKVQAALGTLKSKAQTVGGWLRDTFVGMVNAAVEPFRRLWGMIQNVINALKNISSPDALSSVGDFLGLRSITAPPPEDGQKTLARTLTASTASTTAATSGSGRGLFGGPVVVNRIEINGVVNGQQAAKAIEQLLDRRARALGFQGRA